IFAKDYYLYDYEKTDITNLINLVGKEKVVVLLNIPSAMDTTWLINQDVGAIAVVWMGGEQAGNSIADVCTGVVSPSGKLADTWAKDLQYYPTTKNDWWDSVSDLTTLQNSLNDFGDFGVARYVEDLYVGYRYFATFDPNFETVNYEFGYGLSYTNFNIDVVGVNINKNKGTIKVYAKVTNTGNFAGKEVVQVYYSTPNDVIDAPSKQLIAFAKTETLQPNASQTLTLEFNVNEMSQFDDMGVIKHSAYVMQRGDYNIYVGNSIKDSGKRLVATYTQNANEVIEECNELSTTIDKRLTSDGTYQVINTDGYRVNATGASTIQAENYISNTNVKEPFGDDYAAYEHVSRFEYGMASGQLLRITSGHTFRYRLYVEKAGTYNIDFIMANGSGTNYNDMLQLFVDYTDDAIDNGVNQNATVNLDADANNNWQAWKRVTGNTITFTQTGAVYMTLVCASPCADMDYFVIYNNNVSATSVTEITAANYSYAVNNADATQGPTVEASVFGLCLGYLHSGRQLKYTLNVETAGQYYINLNASSCAYASDNVAKLSVWDTEVGSFKVMRTVDYTYVDLILELPKNIKKF
ncbi:MAG: fibronectin type III-like domain-contianing protein, partial [Clostridia bacterium]|nr:fibronectin type III-like domain-contianing protein [Clostridia bacterium]